MYLLVMDISRPYFCSFFKEEYVENQFVFPRLQAWKDGRQTEILRVLCTGIGVQSVNAGFSL